MTVNTVSQNPYVKNRNGKDANTSLKRNTYPKSPTAINILYYNIKGLSAKKADFYSCLFNLNPTFFLL
jgi:hypothetical protein